VSSQQLSPITYHLYLLETPKNPSNHFFYFLLIQPPTILHFSHHRSPTRRKHSELFPITICPPKKLSDEEIRNINVNVSCFSLKKQKQEDEIQCFTSRKYVSSIKILIVKRHRNKRQQ
jgi:hypothetical protein